MGVFNWLRRGRRGSHGLAGWRRAWADAVADGDETALARLGQELEGSGLPEEEVEIEREMLEALAALCALRTTADQAGLPVIETGHRAAGGARCYFSSPASMPDEPGQPSGRLLLTEHRAVFAGPGSAGMPWHAVARALQVDRDILLIHRGGERTHRFRCNSYTDAVTGACIAQRLMAR